MAIEAMCFSLFPSANLNKENVPLFRNLIKGYLTKKDEKRRPEGLICEMILDFFSWTTQESLKSIEPHRN